MKTSHLIIPLITTLVFACSQISQPTVRQTINPPIEELTPEAQVYTFEASEDHEIITEKGTQISIPANSFVDENGKAVEGEVSIKFTEFHNNTEVMLSGIPMTVQTKDGEVEYFESAGMFTIDGEQGGSPIAIADGKSVNVSLASTKVEEDFGFYEFDEEAGQWVQIQEGSKSEPNRAKNEAEQSIPAEPIQPVNIQRAKSTDRVFELAVDKDRNPEFEGIDNMLWTSADNNFTFSPQSTISDPELTCIDPEEGVYNLEGMSGGAPIEMKVRPVLFGSQYRKAKAKFNEKMADYTKAKEERQKQVTRSEKMYQLQRNINLNSFGTYNFDRFYHLKDKISINPVFLIPVIKKAFDNAFIVIGKDKALIPFRGENGFKLTLSPTEPVTILTLDDEGNLYEFSNRQFSQLNFDRLESEGEYTFEMQQTGITVEDRNSLHNYLTSL